MRAESGTPLLQTQEQGMASTSHGYFPHLPGRLHVVRRAPPPRPASGRGTHARGSSTRTVRERRRRAVAIVEDQKDSLAAYSGYLRMHGYDSVSTFVSGEGLERAVQEGKVTPELVLVDYRLPGKNGIETARKVAGGRPRVKVIVTTADDSIKKEARSLGFHFLQKPFSLAALARMMDRI